MLAVITLLLDHFLAAEVCWSPQIAVSEKRCSTILFNPESTAGLKRKNCRSWFLRWKANSPEVPKSTTIFDICLFLHPSFSIGFGLLSSRTVISDSFLSAEACWSPDTTDPDWRCSSVCSTQTLPQDQSGKNCGSWFLPCKENTPQRPTNYSNFDNSPYLHPFFSIGFGWLSFITVLSDSFPSSQRCWSPETTIYVEKVHFFPHRTYTWTKMEKFCNLILAFDVL